jgi:hypothetical protein
MSIIRSIVSGEGRAEDDAHDGAAVLRPLPARCMLPTSVE